jgi:nucleoside-diphosphate-sugar epimerase
LPATVAVSGASSFTGLWIAAGFRAAGWTVRPLLTQAAGEYAGLRARRVARLIDPAIAGAAESGAMAAWIRSARPEIWIHHHHWMESFRAPSYDIGRAAAVGLAPLDELLDALAASGCRGVVYSGTFFEPGEGGNTPDGTRRATPYGESKLQVWSALRAGAERRGLPVAKMVIPNPIGPLENEDRLIPAMIARTRAGQAIEVRRPEAVADYLPADALGRCYVALAERLLAGESGVVARPSGRQARVADWVDEVNRALIGARLGLAPIAPRLLPTPDDGTQFVSFRNPAAEAVAIDWPAFWDWYAREGGQ